MSESIKTTFCTCLDRKCPLHPANHANGCNPCIAKNLKKGEIPTCFFKKVNPDISALKEFTVESFVNFYLKHKNTDSVI